MKPTYDQLFEMVQMLSAANYTLLQENKRLQKRVAELEERLNLNSKNSSKPPSSDQKKNKQKPKGGAVKGHPGHHRQLSDQPDQRVYSSIEQCGCCGSREFFPKPPYIFQQVDIPDIKPLITQIECERGKCRKCGRNLIASFPKNYDNSSFGPKLTSLIALCSSAYRMSKRTTKQLLKTLLGVDISLGSLPAIERRVSQGLIPCFEELAKEVDAAKVAYVDETGFRQESRGHFVWTATTDKATLLRILPSRGLDSLQQIRPRNHEGITVTDRYQVYSYRRHQYCLAHIYRDFKKFSQRDGPDQDLGQRALFELREIFAACRQGCRKIMQQRVGYRKKRLKEVLYDAYANGSDTFSSFADRLLTHYENLFLFTRYQGVESTNNAAERSLRHIVLWRKTSYGTQSEEGSRFLERALSIWMTLKKQNKEPLHFFQEAYRSSFDPNVKIPTI